LPLASQVLGQVTNKQPGRAPPKKFVWGASPASAVRAVSKMQPKPQKLDIAFRPFPHKMYLFSQASPNTIFSKWPISYFIH
jgi:hypothetical protein